MASAPCRPQVFDLRGSGSGGSSKGWDARSRGRFWRTAFRSGRLRSRPWSSLRSRTTCHLEGTMKILSLYAVSPSQVQESSMSTRKKIVVAIGILAVCGLGLWEGIQMASRLTGAGADFSKPRDEEEGDPEQGHSMRLVFRTGGEALQPGAVRLPCQVPVTESVVAPGNP